LRRNMNTYNINDTNFINSNLYKQYIKKNPKVGFLKIRAYAANEAVPISGLNVIVSKEIDGNNVIFFEGVTDNSGVIEGITLPTETLNSDDLLAPNGTEYTINTLYSPDNIKNTYKINIYENVYVVQTIRIVPKMNRDGDLWQ